jgi:N-acetylmuramoyl-L-alanine amidase
MHWSSSAFRRAGASFTLLLVALSLLFASPGTEEKRLAIYTPRASYSVPVLEREGKEYVALFEALEPLCGFAAAIQRGAWKLRCDKAEAEFKPGKTQAKVGGKRVDLGGQFLLENGHGLVPLQGLQTLLPVFFNQKVELHAAGRRLLLGEALVRFSPELRKEGLLLNFSAPVNPVISTEPGKLKMIFNREPVASGANAYTFDSHLVTSLNYIEVNGRAEVTVTGPVPLLARFENQGRTILLSAAPQHAAGVGTMVAPSPQAPPPAPGNAPVAISSFPAIGGNLAAAAPVVAPPRYVIVVDASHGGEERGAALGDKLAEKDVTLALARRLRMELQARGIALLMTRDGDTTMTPDQRAAVANGARTILFVSLHAGTVGHGVRLYTAMLPTPVGAEGHGPFLQWDTAQRNSLTISHSVAQQISGELTRREVPVQVLLAAVRPLNNIAAPAIAVEVAPPKDQVDVLMSASYQENVASALATVIAVARPRLEQMR